MEQTVVSLEATTGGMVETIQIADPKDPFGVRLDKAIATEPKQRSSQILTIVPRAT